jgi:hypothetical protein
MLRRFWRTLDYYHPALLIPGRCHLRGKATRLATLLGDQDTRLHLPKMLPVLLPRKGAAQRNDRGIGQAGLVTRLQRGALR